MSSKFYAILAVNLHCDELDLKLPHNIDSAKDFLKLINHSRHSYSHELINEQGATSSDLQVFSNSSGTIAFNYDLAFKFSMASSQVNKAAVNFSKLLAIAYNDQCLVDSFSYYEGGHLLRHVCEMDGFEREDVSFKGELLSEEVEYVISSKIDPLCDPDELTQLEIDGQIFNVEGWIPMRGAGFEVAKRLIDIDPLDIHFTESSLFEAKPWWKRW